MNIKLHLTDDTELRAHGFVADSRLFAEVEWDLRPLPGSRGQRAVGHPRDDAAPRRVGHPGCGPGRGGRRLASPHRHHGADPGSTGGMNALLDAALGYAARGIPVYPVHWPCPAPGGASPGCSCRQGVACDRPAKHPLVRHGIHDATCDRAQLERWWQRWPQANLGLATGIVFDALDVDGPAGLAALRQLARTANLRLPGPLVATGGGGWTTGSPPPGSATAHPAASPTSTGAASAGACSPHPVAMSPAAPTAGCATSTRRRCPRYRPPCAACSTPTDQPRPVRSAGPAGPAALGHPYGRRVLAAELAALRRATPGPQSHPQPLPSRSTATSLADCSTTRRSPSPSPPPQSPSA